MFSYCDRQLGDFGNETMTLGALGERTLKLTSPHMKGNDVLELQRFIIDYYKKKGIQALPRWGADGDFGSELKEWLMKFQSDARVTGGADGIAGSNTFNKIAQLKSSGGSVTAQATAKSPETLPVTVQSRSTISPASQPKQLDTSKFLTAGPGKGAMSFFKTPTGMIAAGVGGLATIIGLALLIPKKGAKKKR